jgi:MarR family transcriptional regulator, organic hydroperoxide resistance regulator
VRRDSAISERSTAAASGRPEAGGDDGSTYPASESIGLLMRIALFGLRASFKEVLARHRIPWSAWYYLRVLWEADGISQRTLTERVGAMQPNTVSALRTMEKAGLVTIERPATDRRSTKVWLTPKARRLMASVLPEMRAAARPVLLDGFDERDEAELRRLLNKLCDNVRRPTPRPQGR